MKEDNPYYLGNRECPPTVFILETEKHILSQELPWDVSAQDLCHAFYTACSSMYDSSLVLKTMYAFGSKEMSQDSIWQCKSFLVDPCSMTIKTENSTTKVELTKTSTGTDLCRAFYTLCLGMTFISDGIYDFIKDYAEEMMPKSEEDEEDETNE